MKRLAFYAGSFDPFTKGHLAIVSEALNAFDEVIIGVGVNPDKKGLFEPDERKRLIESSLQDWADCLKYRGLGFSFTKSEERAIAKINEGAVKVVVYDDLTVDAALYYGATALVRGERIVGDHDAEMALSMINRRLLEVREQHLDLISIQVPNPELTYVSSSAVKTLCKMGEYIAAFDFVMPSVHQALMEKFLRFRFEKLPLKDACLAWEDICRVYRQKRYYHTLSHVAYCLNYAEIICRRPEVKNVIDEREKMALDVAIFYHHYCNSGLCDDEEKSCEAMMRYHNPEDCWDCFAESCQKLIMLTKHCLKTKVSDNWVLAKVMHDVDLAVWADEKNYPCYAMQIWQENSAYSQEDYIQNRVEAFEDMLSSRIFIEKWFDEVGARNNIIKEMAYLQNLL